MTEEGRKKSIIVLIAPQIKLGPDQISRALSMSFFFYFFFFIFCILNIFIFVFLKKLYKRHSIAHNKSIALL